MIMAIDNVHKVEFTEAEIKVLNDAIAAIEQVFKNKAVQLTKEEGRHFGKLGKESEGWAIAVHQDVVSNPMLIPAHIDAEVWAKNELAREVLSPLTKRLENITQQIKDTNRVVGYSLILACKAVYKNAKVLSEQNVLGFKLYYDKWKVQFANKGRKKASKKTENEG
jgi:hypothetical protein